MNNINKIIFNEEINDCLENCVRWEIKIDKEGLVALIDVMPRFIPKGKTADFAICQAARVSYGMGTKKVNEDKGLLRYLLRHQHTTPFEMIEFKFHCIMPIFVARQWIRHRTASVNEYSARYSIIPDKFYRPLIENIRKQSSNNRQGGNEIIDTKTAEEFLNYLEEIEKSYKNYENMLEKGISRELARIALPISIYTEWYWKIDLHNLFRFLWLRMDEHSQIEIRQYANAMFTLIKEIVPISCEAFIDYQISSIKLTRLEIDAIKNKKPIETKNSREIDEFNEKLKILGL